MSAADVPALMERLKSTPLGSQRALLTKFYTWKNFARPKQLPPPGPWRTWAVNGGRGSGKTRTGSETFRGWAESGEMRRGALVGRTAADTRDVMVEGPSGICSISPPWSRPTYYPSKRRLVWHTLRDQLGFAPMATLYSADKPDMLRGPEHDKVWADEVASWRYDDAWSNLQFGLRQGDNPCVIATTTPRPTLLIKKLYARESTVVTTSSTYENAANLADAALEEFLLEYEGTELGRQELRGELLEEAEGALWKREWIEDNRLTERDDEKNLIIPELDGLVIAVDPAMTSKATSNETGIIGVGRETRIDVDGRPEAHYYVIDDASGRLKPHKWAGAAIEMRQHYEADYILGEVNNGGDLVEFTVQTVDDTELFKAVHAARGKRPRAEPVAAAYAQGRVHHVGPFDELEDQLCNWDPSEPDKTPNDRLDAVVWGVTELSLKRKRRIQGNISFGDLSKPSYFRGGNV